MKGRRADTLVHSSEELWRGRCCFGLLSSAEAWRFKLSQSTTVLVNLFWLFRDVRLNAAMVGHVGKTMLPNFS